MLISLVLSEGLHFLAIVGTEMRWVFWLGQFLNRPICARVFLAYVRIFRDLKLFERNF